MTKKRHEWGLVCEAAAIAPAIHSAAEAAEAVRSQIERTNGYEFEHIVAVFLNTQNKIISSCVVGVGGFAEAQVLPAVLFKKFFTTKGATTFILGHNHPSGVVTPSETDIHFSSAVGVLAKTLGVEMLDCLVVTHDRHAQIPFHT